MPKIREIKAHPIEVPKKPWANAKGSTSVQRAVIAEVITDEGISGFGEINPGYGIPRETLQEILTAIGTFLTDALVGQELDILQVIRRMDRALHNHQMSKDAVQTAALDALGKTLGVPLHTLLGGRLVDRVNLAGPIGIGTVEQTLQEADQHLNERGFRALKIKIGKNPAEDIRRIREVRKQVGDDIVIRVDINESYDLSTALRFIHAVEDCNLQSIEQPVPAWHTEGLRRVTNATAALIMGDESAQSPTEAMQLAQSNLVTAFHIKGAGRGGPVGAQRIGQIGALAGIPSICGRISTLTLGAAVDLHIVAATPGVLLPGEMAGHLFAFDDITTERMELKDGSVPVPTGPGIGFEVDRAKLEKYRI